jgi:beta-lactam-binding protein with PASTA domain
VEEVRSFEKKGTVLTQKPEGGTARLGSPVNLQVSNGKGDPVIVPRVVDLPEAEAVKLLKRLGLIADVQYVTVRREAADGIVVDQVPIGNGSKLVDVGATITIFVGEFDAGGGGGGGDGGGEEPSPSPSPSTEAGAMSDQSL